MPRYNVTLTEGEVKELKALIQKGGKGYKIKRAQILLKLEQKPENIEKQRFVKEGLESALGRKQQENRHRNVTGDVEARICVIACSDPPEGASRWTMQAIADELIRLEVVDYITGSTICDVLKKRDQAVACQRVVHSKGGRGIRSQNGGCAGRISAAL